MPMAKGKGDWALKGKPMTKEEFREKNRQLSMDLQRKKMRHQVAREYAAGKTAEQAGERRLARNLMNEKSIDGLLSGEITSISPTMRTNEALLDAITDIRTTPQEELVFGEDD
jgi:hypothetical protein